MWQNMVAQTEYMQCMYQDNKNEYFVVANNVADNV